MALGGVVTQARVASYDLSGTTLNFTNAAAIAAGELIYIAAFTQSSRTLTGITDPAGNSYATSPANTTYSNKNLGIRWTRSASAIPAGSTFTATFSGTSYRVLLMQSITGTAASPLVLAGTGATGASGPPEYIDASTHSVATAMGFGATLLIDGEQGGVMVPDAAWGNVITETVGGLGRLTLASRLVTTTAQITKTDSDTGKAWISNVYWFADDGITPTASAGGRLLKGVG